MLHKSYLFASGHTGVLRLTHPPRPPPRPRPGRGARRGTETANQTVTAGSVKEGRFYKFAIRNHPARFGQSPGGKDQHLSAKGHPPVSEPVPAPLAAETPATAGWLPGRADGWWLKGLSLTKIDRDGIVHPRFRGSARTGKSPDRCGSRRRRAAIQPFGRPLVARSIRSATGRPSWPPKRIMPASAMGRRCVFSAIYWFFALRFIIGLEYAVRCMLRCTVRFALPAVRAAGGTV